MARTKATVRRLPATAASDFQRRTVRPFKIKEILLQRKTRTDDKNNQCRKKIKVFFRQK